MKGISIEMKIIAKCPIEGHTSLVLLPNSGRHRRSVARQRHRHCHESRARVRDVVGDAVLLVPHDARHLGVDFGLGRDQVVDVPLPRRILDHRLLGEFSSFQAHSLARFRLSDIE